MISVKFTGHTGLLRYNLSLIAYKGNNFLQTNLTRPHPV